MDDPTPLASLSLTHVYYNPNDPLSYLCAWLALVPQALCIVYATLIWSTREAEVALMFAGQLGCEAVNFVLKRLIKEERPLRIHLTGKGYGMPSSHAQFAFFWAVALGLFLMVRHRPRERKEEGAKKDVVGGKVVEGNGRNEAAQTNKNNAKGKSASQGILAAVEEHTRQPWSFAERLLVSTAALGVAAAVAWSRVYLDYHTPKQVAVGCVAGALSAVAWFVATYVVREIGLLAWALEIPLARWMRLRDLIVEEDLCQAGWEKWELLRNEEKERKTR